MPRSAFADSALADRVVRPVDDRPVLVDGSTGEVTTARRLAERVDERLTALELGPRSLVALAGPNGDDLVVTYLALLVGGHVPLLAARDPGEVADRWGCHAVVDAGTITHRHRDEVAVHPDLALVLSTSGSTGSPKMVRLSRRNLDANAAAIVESLGLTDTDRGITSLPLSYCYGLSVLHSHLLAGASLVTTDLSVVDPCFHRLLDDHRVTNLAGVPHTFELLERARFAPADHPSLRLVTQAGGRMAPARVLRWHERLASAGADLVVMYGQTEATARMAVLPPDCTGDHPGSIGRPIPGGSIELRPVVGQPADVGEIVYRGPNVMMGYASDAAELARGAELDELATGDLARRDPLTGLLTIVGRTSRFVKPFGLRIDLDRVEQALASAGHGVLVAGDDDGLVVGVVGDRHAVVDRVGDLTGLPASATVVVDYRELPLTANGKPDRGAVLADGRHRVASSTPRPDGARALFAEVFGRPADEIADDATFVSLGGDSLRYVECALRLEELVVDLPSDWHLRTVVDLDARAVVSDGRRWVPLDTTVVLRAVAICAVVVTHMQLWRVPGGAHVMLAVSGYNVARFQAVRASAGDVVRSGLRTIARVGAPASGWIGLNMLIAGGYGIGSLLLVNNYVGSAWRTEGRWRYWYFEVFAQLTALVTVLLLVPAVRRLARSHPFGLAVGLLVPALVLRFELVVLGDDYNALFRTHWVAWFFFLGWAIVAAERRWQRWLVTVLVVTTVPGFFDRPQRDAVVVVALLLLVWVRSVPLPRFVRPVVATVAAASLWILLAHWQVWPPIDRVLLKPYAVVATIAVCVGMWWLVDRAAPRAWRVLRQRSTG